MGVVVEHGAGLQVGVELRLRLRVERLVEVLLALVHLSFFGGDVWLEWGPWVGGWVVGFVLGFGWNGVGGVGWWKQEARGR